MTEVAFSIPGRPVAWSRATAFADPRSGKMMRTNPKAMKAHQKMVGQLTALTMRGKARLTGPLKLEVLAVYAIPASWPEAKKQAARDGKVWKTTVPDLDNLAKQIADAMNSIAYGDDAQIVKEVLGKRYGSPERTDVRLTTMDVLDDHTSPGAFREEAARRAGQQTLDLPPSNACNTQSGKSA